MSNTTALSGMNIAIDIRSLMSPIRTGVGEYTYELLQALFSIDHENVYVLFYNSANDVSAWLPKWSQENVHYVGTRYPNKLFNSSVRLLQRPRFDTIVHSQLVMAHYFGKNQQSNNRAIKQSNNDNDIDIWFSPNLGFTALDPKIRHIITIHDLSFEHFPDRYSWKRRVWHQVLNPKQQCEQADLILTPSENTRRDVIETYGIPGKKVRCVYPGLSEKFMTHDTDNITQVKQKYDLPEKFILFLGTIEPRKNILGLVEAFKQCHKLLASGYQLVIAGPRGWKYTSILHAIEQTPGARYIGYVAPEDKSVLYQLASLFVYPSLYEGFGFPVLEAMAAGTSVITSNRSSLPEVAGGAAYLINPYNVSELGRAMETVTSDTWLRGRMIERGKRRAGEFRWEETAGQFLELIRDRHNI